MSSMSGKLERDAGWGSCALFAFCEVGWVERRPAKGLPRVPLGSATPGCCQATNTTGRQPWSPEELMLGVFAIMCAWPRKEADSLLLLSIECLLGDALPTSYDFLAGQRDRWAAFNRLCLSSRARAMLTTARSISLEAMTGKWIAHPNTPNDPVASGLQLRLSLSKRAERVVTGSFLNPMVQAAPASADATNSIVHWNLFPGLEKTPGACSRSTNKLIMLASKIAARQGTTRHKIATPADKCPTPVKYARKTRCGSHAGTIAAVASTYTK